MKVLALEKLIVYRCKLEMNSLRCEGCASSMYVRDSDYDAIMMKDTFLNKHVVDRPINFPVQASVLVPQTITQDLGLLCNLYSQQSLLTSCHYTHH